MHRRITTIYETETMKEFFHKSNGTVIFENRQIAEIAIQEYSINMCEKSCENGVNICGTFSVLYYDRRRNIKALFVSTPFFPNDKNYLMQLIDNLRALTASLVQEYKNRSKK